MRLIEATHPIIPTKDMKVYELDAPANTTLYDVLEPIGGLNEIYSVYVNNNLVNVDDYINRTLAVNDVVVIKQNVHGGEGGSQIALVVAAIVIAIYAPYASAAIFEGTALAGTAAQTALTAAIVIGGNLALQHLFAPALPSPDVNPESFSPSSSVSGIQNRARLDQPLPLVLGRHIVVPDLSSRYWSEWVGEDNYFYAIFCIALNSDLTITNIKIGNESLSTFSDIETEFSVGDTGEIKSFPTNLDSFVLNDPATTEIIQTTNPDTIRITIDFGGSLVAYNKKGNASKHSLLFQVLYRKQGDTTWLAFNDTRVISSPLSKYNNELGILVLENASSKPYRVSISQSVDPADTYEVKIKRLSPEESDDKKISSVNVVQIKAQQRDDQGIYRYQKRFAFRVKASGGVQGQLDAVSMVCHSRFPDWNGVSWVTSDTSNPASIFRALCLGQTDDNGKRVWGAGLTEDDLDSDSLEEWHEFCEDKNLEFNFVLDQPTSVFEMLQMVARVGRASVHFTGKIGVVIDKENLVLSQIFNLGNIKQDTYEVSYISQEFNDQYIIEFLNEDINFAPDEVRVNLPGVTQPINPSRFRIAGITNSDQCGREAALVGGAAIFRNKRVSFEVSMAGLVINRGDVIQVSHDMTSFDQSGRLNNDYAHTTTTIKVDQPLVFEAGSTPQIVIMHPDGSVDGPHNVVIPAGSPIPETDTITLSTSLNINPSLYPANEPHDAVFQFNKNTEPGERLKVLAIEYGGDDSTEVKLTCIPDSQDYYDSENNSYDYSPATLFNNGIADISNVQVANELLNENGPIKVTVSYDLEDAIGVNAEYIDHNSTNTNVSTPILIGNIFARQFSFEVPRPTTITLKLRTIPSDPKRFNPETFEDTYNIAGINIGNAGLQIPVMPIISGLELYEIGNNGGIIGQGNNTEFTGNTARFIWRKVGIDHTEFGGDPNKIGADEGIHDTWFHDYEVKFFRTDGTLLRTTYTVNNKEDYTIEENKIDTGLQPVREFIIEVRARGKQNQLSAIPARITVSNPPPAVPTGIQVTPAFESINVKLIPPDDPDFKEILVFVSTSSGFTPSGTVVGSGNLKFAGPDGAIFVDELVSGTNYYVRVAAADSFGRTGLNYSSEFVAQTATVDIEPNKYMFEGIRFDPEGTTSNQVDWSSGTATVSGTTAYAISAGNAAYTGSDVYVYWLEGQTTLSTTTSLSTAVSTTSQILGTYKGGKEWVQGSGAGDAYLDGSIVIAGTLAGSKIIGGTIAGDRMVANTLTAAQIATDAITANELAANSVSASKIQANSISASKMQANSITAANGAIASLTVSTIKIQDQAVTFSVASEQVGSLYLSSLPSNDGWHDLLSVNITTTGAPVLINMYLIANTFTEFGGDADMRILRGGTTLKTYTVVDNPGAYLGNSETASISPMKRDTPVAGNYTYKMQVQRDAGDVSATFAEAVLVVLETKK